VPGVPEEGYSVEFFDMTGNTVAVATLPASAVSRIGGPVPRIGAPDGCQGLDKRASVAQNDPV
jgi:hypothetical protein